MSWKSNKRKANDEESKLAKELNATKCCNSGSVYNDGDVRDSVFCYDEKNTSAKTQCTLKLKELDKLSNQAFEIDLIPVLVPNISGRKFAVLSLDDFIYIKDFLILHNFTS